MLKERPACQNVNQHRKVKLICIAFLGYLKTHAHIYTINTTTNLTHILFGVCLQPICAYYKVIEGVKIEQIISCYMNKQHLFHNCNRHQLL